MGHGTDGAVVAELCFGKDRAGLEVGTIPHPAVGHHHPRLDEALGADAGCAAQVDAGVDSRIGTDLHLWIDVGRRRVDQGHAGAHVGLVDPAAHDLPGPRQLDAVVDPHGLFGIIGDQRTDLATGRPGHRDHVGQVILTLGIIPTHPAQRLEDEGRLEGVDAGIDLANRALLRRRVLFFDNAQDRFAISPNDASVTVGIGHLGGKDRDRRLLGPVVGKQAIEGFPPQQRNVAAQQQQSPAEAQQLGFGAKQGMAGSQLIFLQGEANRLRRQGLLYRLGPMTNHQHRRLGPQAGGEARRVEGHGQAGNGVKNFGLFRFHPGPPPGGEDDRGQFFIAHRVFPLRFQKNA